MDAKYRVIHQRKSIFEALLNGRTYTDWYIAQHRRWYGWKKLGVFSSHDEARQACENHAGGTLLSNGTRIVSEFVMRDPE